MPVAKHRRARSRFVTHGAAGSGGGSARGALHTRSFESRDSVSTLSIVDGFAEPQQHTDRQGLARGCRRAKAGFVNRFGAFCFFYSNP